ncbi:hypothetical protein GQ53DRAFT_756400 [Thozetella sp. PMI_491]|nr:hypothetical protein GQ53DRAFT_756400 [Thozetella sp. PMI_491]
MFYEWASEDEKRSFHFFQHVTAPCLSGDFDGIFWRVLVLQICQTEPAVKHAVLAVSSLHEGMVKNSFASAPPFVEDCDRQAFALCQYNKAIACLLGLMSNADTRPLVPLLTCVLFVCIEFMQSKDRESLVHLEQGRHILSQMEKKLSSVRGPEIDMIKQHLVPMYTRLSLTSFMIGGSPVKIPCILKTMNRLPAMFETIDQVRYALYDFMDECFRFTQRARPVKYSNDISAGELRGLEEEQDYLLGKMAKFKVAFSLYQTSGPRDAPAGSLDLIQVHIHTTSIWIATALARSETAYDDHLSTFSAIIPLVSSFIDTLGPPPPTKAATQSGRSASAASTPAPGASTPQSNSKRFSSMFTFEIHFIASLYYVVTKCRHPLVRRAALDLLKRNPSRRENLWRAGVMAAIAQNMVNLEEKHLHEGSVSPPPEPRTAPFTNGFTPEGCWATGGQDLPLPDEYRTDLAAEEQKEAGFQWYDQDMPVDEAVAAAYSAAGGAAAGLGVGSDLVGAGDFVGLGLEMPVDSNLVLDPISPEFSSSAPASIASFDDPSGLYIGEPTLAPTSQAHWPGSVRSTPTMHREPKAPARASQGGRAGQHLGGSMSFPTAHQRMGSVSAASDASRQSSPRERKKTRDQDWLQSRNMDAPFDVPEELRVHDAVIGPEKDDGSWVLMFRKLDGLDGDWDLQAAYVPALTA